MSLMRRKDEPYFGQPVVLRDEMNRLFDSFFPSATAPGTRESAWGSNFLPAIDIHETDTEIVVSAELPGMKPENVDINLTGNVLTIKGEKKEESDEKGKNWHRVERSYGQFARSFQLPESVDPERSKASYDNGVLKVSIAKSEAARPRSIKVDVRK